ncbi:MAG: hypothetical protein AAGU05_11115 [Anaerolineaceae bacterium]
MPDAGQKFKQPAQHAHGQRVGQPDQITQRRQDHHHQQGQQHLPAEESRPDGANLQTQIVVILAELGRHQPLHPLGQ